MYSCFFVGPGAHDNGPAIQLEPRVDCYQWPGDCYRWPGQDVSVCPDAVKAFFDGDPDSDMVIELVEESKGNNWLNAMAIVFAGQQVRSASRDRTLWLDKEKGQVMCHTADTLNCHYVPCDSDFEATDWRVIG